MSNTKRVIALGFFDGVHKGHGALLSTVTRRAQELDAAACAFTFDRSPTAAITGQVVPDSAPAQLGGGPCVADAQLLRHPGGHRVQL